MTATDRLYTTEEVANRIGVRVQQLAGLVKDGLKPAAPGGSGRGNTHRFSREQLRLLSEWAALNRRKKAVRKALGIRRGGRDE